MPNSEASSLPFLNDPENNLLRCHCSMSQHRIGWIRAKHVRLARQAAKVRVPSQCMCYIHFVWSQRTLLATSEPLVKVPSGLRPASLLFEVVSAAPWEA